MQEEKKYYYKYPDIKFKNENGTITEYAIKIIAVIPRNYCFVYGDSPYLIYYQINGNNEKKYLKYYDTPSLKGKLKWVFENVEESALDVKELPTVIDCSLNTFEHPSKRKWFLHKNFGLLSQEYIEIDWKLWKDYDIMIEYNEIKLLYKIISDLVQKIMPLNKDYNTLKSIVGEQFLLNYPYKMDVSTLEEFHINYLRDILKLWD